jgi:hypothetical protein
VEIEKQTSGELTSVDVISYVEALSQSASLMSSGEKNQTAKPAVTKATLRVIFISTSIVIAFLEVGY